MGKEHLEKIFRLDQLIQIKIKELEYLKELSGNLAGYMGQREQDLNKNNKMQNSIIKINRLEEEIDNTIYNLVEIRTVLYTKVEEVENDEYRMLLMLRYFQYMTWEQIAEEMGYSFQWVHKLHKRALAEFEKISKRELIKH